MKWLRWLWPAPWTAFGLLAGALMCLGGARVRRRDGCVEFLGGAFGRAVAAHGRFAAMTLGHVILATSQEQAEHLGAHERVHVRQYERWGPLFVPAYLVAGGWQWLCGRCAYADNPFERAAGVRQ
jgi:hypothetical protein